MKKQLVLWFCLVCFAFGHDASSFKDAVVSSRTFWDVPLVDHYTTVGFPPAKSVEEQMENTKKFVMHPDTVRFPASTPGWNMLHLQTKCGAELWGGANADHEFFGHDPHFFGLSRLRVKLMSKEEREYEECIFTGRASNFKDKEQEPDCLHFDFYCPTYQLYGRQLELPTIVTAQVAAFACEIQIFDTIEDYDEFCEKQQEKGKIAMAEQSFGAMSMFDSDKATYAVFTGRVVQAERKVNERTGEPFYWALVETLGDCQMDVVIHPMLVTDGRPPRPGCIVQGAFYLSGRLLPDE